MPHQKFSDFTIPVQTWFCQTLQAKKKFHAGADSTGHVIFFLRSNGNAWRTLAKTKKFDVNLTRMRTQFILGLLHAHICCALDFYTMYPGHKTFQ